MGAACRELQACVELRDGAVIISGERAQLHKERCPSCRALVDELARSVDAVSASGAELDEITRAAMLRKMAPELDDLAATYGGRGRRRWELRLRPMTAALAVAAVALFAVGVYELGKGRSREASAPLVVAAPSPTAVAMHPYVIAGEISRTPTAESLLGGAITHLSVAAGSRVRALIPHGDIELVGPGELGIAAGDDGGYQLSLSGGTLLAEIDPPSSPSARPPIQVITASAAVTVVGTIFSVGDDGATTRVAVTRGEVAVAPRGGGAAAVLAADQQWHDGLALPISASQRRALNEHAASRLDRPDRARLVELVDSSGVGVSVQGRKIGVTPLVAWIESGVEVVLDGAAREAPVAAVAASYDAGAAVAVAPAVKVGKRGGDAGVADSDAAELPAPAASWSAEERYDKAEAALRAGEADEAEAYWRDMVRRYPEHALTDLALYDLAQLAARRGRHGQALGYVKSVLARDRDPALREPASWLRCQLVGELAAAAEARSCLEEFRASFPGSPHDGEARRMIESADRAPPDPGLEPAPQPSKP